MIIDPDYPHVILTLIYRGCKIEISQDFHHGQTIYTAWVNYHQGCAVAVPCAYSCNLAISKAKTWIQGKLV